MGSRIRKNRHPPKANAAPRTTARIASTSCIQTPSVDRMFGSGLCADIRTCATGGHRPVRMTGRAVRPAQCGDADDRRSRQTPPPTVRIGGGPLTPLVAIVLVMVAALALREIASLVVPVVFGLFLALVAWPLVGRLEARGSPPCRRADGDAPRRARDRRRRGPRRRVLDRGAGDPDPALRGPLPGARHGGPDAARGVRRHGRPGGDHVGGVGEPGAVVAAAGGVGRVGDRASGCSSSRSR